VLDSFQTACFPPVFLHWWLCLVLRALMVAQPSLWDGRVPGPDILWSAKFCWDDICWIRASFARICLCLNNRRILGGALSYLRALLSSDYSEWINQALGSDKLKGDYMVHSVRSSSITGCIKLREFVREKRWSYNNSLLNPRGLLATSPPNNVSAI
jgi:hypothetical protein